MQSDAGRCLAAGMDAYIAKPLRPEELATAIYQLAQGGIGSHPPTAAPPVDLAASLC